MAFHPKVQCPAASPCCADRLLSRSSQERQREPRACAGVAVLAECGGVAAHGRGDPGRRDPGERASGWRPGAVERCVVWKWGGVGMRGQCIDRLQTLDVARKAHGSARGRGGAGCARCDCVCMPGRFRRVRAAPAQHDRWQHGGRPRRAQGSLSPPRSPRPPRRRPRRAPRPSHGGSCPPSPGGGHFI
jgi:hypothetical protein